MRLLVHKKYESNRRRVLRWNIESYLTEQDLLDLVEESKLICIICRMNIEVTPLKKSKYSKHLDELSFDHIIPLALGGPDSKDNLRVVHLKCNYRAPRKPSSKNIITTKNAMLAFRFWKSSRFTWLPPWANQKDINELKQLSKLPRYEALRQFLLWFDNNKPPTI